MDPAEGIANFIQAGTQIHSCEIPLQLECNIIYSNSLSNMCLKQCHWCNIQHQCYMCQHNEIQYNSCLENKKERKKTAFMNEVMVIMTLSEKVKSSKFDFEVH